MKKSFALLLSILLLIAILPQNVSAAENAPTLVFDTSLENGLPPPIPEAIPEPLPRWSSMAAISQAVTKSGNGVSCYYNARAYSDITKIVVYSTLYEYKNGAYQVISTWSHTHDTYYGYADVYRATSGGACKYVATYSTYIGNTFQESITVTHYT